MRDARNWKAGQVFAFISKGTGVLLVPVPKRKDLAGIAKGAKAEDYRDRKSREQPEQRGRDLLLISRGQKQLRQSRKYVPGRRQQLRAIRFHSCTLPEV